MTKSAHVDGFGRKAKALSHVEIRRLFHAHLPDALLPQLAALARDAAASRLVLFGSRARGDNRERSDIDLAVFGLDAAQSGRLRLALEELPTLLEFDLVCVDANTSPQLLDNIEREGVTLYASEM